MKTRNGFVSNSSSSSFIIIAKPGTYSIKEEIEKALVLPEDNIWHKFSKEAAKTFWNRAYEETYEEMLDLNLPEEQLEYIRNGGNFFYGSISNEDPGVDCALCNLEIDYENEHIIIQKEEGY